MAETYLTDKQIASRFGVVQHTIWRWVREGHFPPPVRLGPGCTRWTTEDVEAFEAARRSERKPGPKPASAAGA